MSCRWPQFLIRAQLQITCFVAVGVLLLGAGGERERSHRSTGSRPAANSVTITNGTGTFELFLRAGEERDLILSRVDRSLSPAQVEVVAATAPTSLWASDNSHSGTLAVQTVNRSVMPVSHDASAVQYRDRSADVTFEAPVEQTRDFWIHVGGDTLEDRRGYQLVTGRAVAQTRHVVVMIDESQGLSHSVATTLRDKAEQVARELSGFTLPAVADLIGPVTDVDRNGRLTVLITPWLGRLRGGTTVVQGFVRSTDFRPEFAPPFSNRGDILYLNSELPVSAALRTLLLHEVTHAALFSVAPQSGSRRSLDWEDWLNEGIAHLVERSDGNWSNVDYRVARFWQQTAQSPLIVPDYFRSGRWRDHGCRGATCLFMDWCVREYRLTHPDRGLRDFLQALIRQRQSGLRAVEQVLQRPIGELIHDWGIDEAISAADSNGQLDDPLNDQLLGRVAVSGPRKDRWTVDVTSRFTAELCGTTNRIVSLSADSDGHYRFNLTAPAGTEWRVSTVSPAALCRLTLSVDPLLRTPIGQNSSDQDAYGPNKLVAIKSSPYGLSPSSYRVLLSGPAAGEAEIELLAFEHVAEGRSVIRTWMGWQLAGKPDSLGGSTDEMMVIVPEISPTARPVWKARVRLADGRRHWLWADSPESVRPSPLPIAEKSISVTR